MNRFWIVLLTTAALAATIRFSQHAPVQAEKGSEETVARGIVYHDANHNGRHDPDEPGLPDVRVSNGREIVATDESGRYQLPIADDAEIFVIKPRNWRTPINELQLPQFYYTHKPQGSPPSRFAGVDPTGALPSAINFALYPQKEPDEFKAILFGDPQPRNQEEVDYIGHDVVEELVGTDAAFGVTLGDIVFDDLSMFESQARTIALLGIPWYNVIGNHDINLDATHDKYSDETFERVFGPAYYSFDYGPVHFIVLDDIEWYIDDASGKGRYRGGFGPDQLQWVKNDLALIPKDQLVVLLMHIPLVDVGDRKELYRLIEKRPFCMSVSGHTHTQEHRFITKADGWMGPQPHHHVINVTVSGSWWSGAPDSRGIPHTMMADGAPNGYSIIKFDGHDYSLQFRAAGRPENYQVRLTCPEVVPAGSSTPTVVYANVFNGSPRSIVEMQVGKGAEWVRMKRVQAVDPSFQKLRDRELAIEKRSWRDMPNPRTSSHLWAVELPANLPVGSHMVSIRARDSIFGEVRGSRILRVEPAAAAAAP